jgi:hypothetical protein
MQIKLKEIAFANGAGAVFADSNSHFETFVLK